MEKETIALTMDECIRAIRLDFQQYDPQPLLFGELLRLISDNRSEMVREPGSNGVWIQSAGGSKMRWLEGPELVDYMCEAISDDAICHHPDMLALIAARVFQAKTRLTHDPKTGGTQILIHTGMQDFTCRQCGHCCRRLDYHNEITAEDVARWRNAERPDILKWVGITQHRDKSPTYQIWVTPGTNQYANPCPFLEKVPTRHQWICKIHDTKPKICRQYPISRKHAVKTGCKGFA